MAVRKIYQSVLVGGNSEEERVLRSISQEVLLLDEYCKEVIGDLRDTIKQFPFCCGLSAPQIGHSIAISIIDLNRIGAEGDLVMINPHIIEIKGKKDRKRESCMSVWGKQGEVERRDKLLVEYRDETFNSITREFTGFESRCIQHELDHLKGVLYVDRLVPGTELTSAAFFGEFNKKEN